MKGLGDAGGRQPAAHRRAIQLATGTMPLNITLEYYPIFSGMVPVASWIVLPCAAGFRPPASPKRFMVQQYCYVVFAIVVWCMRVGKSSL